MSTITVEWWESVCVELSRNPVAATKIITDFRDSEQALEASKYFLQPSTCCSPVAQFQATLILQYVCLKHWSKLSISDTQDLRNTLWTLLHTSLAAGTMPTFALNKIMQVYALLWKRGWPESDIACRQQLFQQIRALMQKQEYMKTGATLLRTIFEEFCSRSSAEIGLPMEFHRVAHNAFDQSGVDEGLEIAVQCLGASFSALASLSDVPQTVASAAAAVSAASKLLVEVMNWDFGDSERFSFGMSKEIDKEKQRSNDLLALPRKWSPLLLNEKFTVEVFSAYKQLRAIHTHFSHARSKGGGFSQTAESEALSVVEDSLCEIRLLISALSSITGTFFAEDSEKAGMFGCISSLVRPLLVSALVATPHTAPSSSLSPGHTASPGQGQGVGWQKGEELRALECVHFASVILRLLGNFRFSIARLMPGSTLEELLGTLGGATFQISEELAGLAESQLNELFSIKMKGGGISSCGDDPGSLLEGWRGETLDFLLESWCMILDDPLMSTDVTNVIAPHFKEGLRAIGGRTFSQLYECLLRSTVYNTVAEMEDEDEEEYSSVSTSLLRSVCAVGRSNFESAVLHVYNSLLKSMSDASEVSQLSRSDPAVELNRVKVLESLRVGILFLSHLCVDDLKSTLSGGTDEDVGGSSDTPVIPGLILAEFRGSVRLGQLLRECVTLVARTVQMEVHLLSISTAHPMVSPLLLEACFLFFAHYSARYLDPDSSLYGNDVLLSSPQAFAIHGEDIFPILDLLLSSTHSLLVSLPFEDSLVSAIADLLISLSKTGTARKTPAIISSYVIGRPSFSNIFSLITGAHHSSTSPQVSFAQSQPLCRLNAEGLRLMYGAISALAVRTEDSSMFTQLCSAVHCKVAATASTSLSSADRDGRMVIAQQAISALRGTARSPPGKEIMLHQLFDQCLPLLSSSMQSYTSCDDLLKAYLELLRDYAESQLSSCSAPSSQTVYLASLSALHKCAARLHLPLLAQTASSAAADEESSYRSDLLLIALQLLNHLSTKDFLLDDDESPTPTTPLSLTGPTQTATVANVLLYGLEVLLPLISVDLLKSFPTTAERYFSFLAFVVSSYEEEFRSRVNSNSSEGLESDFGINSRSSSSGGGQLLRVTVQHCMWGAGATDTSCARLALQALQTLALFQGKSSRSGREGFSSVLADSIFPSCAERLLQMLVFPATAESGISWDRIDGCANTYISLISLDNASFSRSVTTLIGQQEECLRPTLVCSFERLVTAGGVSINRTDKNNRQIFSKNLKEFVVAVRPLLSYK